MSGHRHLGAREDYGREESNAPWGPELGCTAGGMETTLEQQWGDTVKNPPVAGVLCPDPQGLNLGCRGTHQRSVLGWYLFWPSKQLS